MAFQPLRIAIVGSGLGGAVLADLLAGRHEITVFERGPECPARPEPPVMTAHRFGLYPSFAYGLGGTTNFWHGGLVALLDEEMGDAWPEAPRRELPRYYGCVVRQLYGANAERVWQESEKTKLKDGITPAQLFYPRAPFRAAASGFLTMARLRTGHRVEQVTERAGGVDVLSRADADREVSHFDRVILAAGCMNSPLVLRNSGLGGEQAGRNFTDHPMGFVAKLSAAAPSDAFLRLRTTHRSGNHAEPMLKVRDSETGLWSAFYLRAAAGAQIRSDPYRRSFAFLAETSRAGKRLAALPHLRDADFLWQACENQLGVALPSNHAHVLVVNEQEALGQGTVAASADGRLVVDWRLSDEVEGAIRRNLDRLAAYTGATLTLPDGSLRDRLWSAAHHSGTCRISADVETGVIDADLRVHGAQHVYVCDGSILPSTGASNTGLTIAALAHRLAERLNGERRFSAASPTQGRLLISGATGAVGRMMRSRLADLDIDWHELDLRHPETGTSTRPGAGVLLHLANAHQSVADNVKLQERAAAAMAAADIEQVIVPMSAATFESTGPAGPKSTAENFGFTYAGTDSYSVGKLAAERFWLDWQAAKPGRTLALIYVPTIMGPRSQWTRKIANHAPDKILIVPQLERLLAVSETDLVEGLARLAKDGVADGVSRHFVLSPSTSLAQSILSDRGHGVTVLRLPRPVWSMMEFSGRSPLIDKALTAARTVADRMLRPFGYAIVPISARYLDLFRRQSDMAATIEAAAQSSRADYRCG